jgi:hypothetical protein
VDDVIIKADSLESLHEGLRELFHRFSESKLKIEPFKCEFLRVEVQFLGPKKMGVVRNIPEPMTVKQLKGFFGISPCYRRSIYNYTKVAKLLYEIRIY